MATHGHSALSETRDVREATTLAHVLESVNRGDIATALDIVVMRLQALQRAKTKGGSWEKAAKIELILEAAGETLAAGIAAIASQARIRWPRPQRFMGPSWS